MPYLKQVVYLSAEQLNTLYAQGSVTVDGKTVEYSENDIYVTPQGEVATIDDTAGTGDTNKVWSADKTTGELNNKQDAPATAGTAGQVLGLDSSLNPVWVTQSGGGGSGGVSDVQVNGESVVIGGVANVALATDETGQELLDKETGNAGLTETALAVIGLLFDRMPQNETATDIYYSLLLENERLLAIYEIWEVERSA